ncbi:MAG: DUF4363 family protein [Oscillospiraceae bacterium]
MTRLITITAIMIAMLALSISGIYYAKETKTQFDELIDIALVQCKNKDTQTLAESTKKMSALYQSRHGFLSFFVRHDELEKIDIDLVSLLGYVKIGSFDSIQICLEQIRFMINHIYSKELPNIENLF